MSDTNAPNVGELNIGEQAKPPFAVLPDTTKLFKSRSSRFATLATGNELEPYLLFLARLTEAQHAASAALPDPVLPPQDDIAKALAHAMPPLGVVKTGGGFSQAILAVLDKLGEKDLPEATVTAIVRLRAMTPEALDAFSASALTGSDTDAGDLAERALASAGLQVHFAKLAAKLDADALASVAEGACPSCGSPPVASTIVNWPRASNTRFCSCSLCGTMWNVVRVKCVLCNSTGGITYHKVDGQSDAIKAESCDSCRAYVKIVYQPVDPAVEPMADDVASLGLDMLMGEDGWKRGGKNPFLLGY